jgi:hypothetical protein
MIEVSRGSALLAVTSLREDFHLHVDVRAGPTKQKRRPEGRRSAAGG